MTQLLMRLFLAGVLLTALLSTITWTADGRAEADPESAELGIGLLSNTHQLIFEGRRSGEGYFNASGSKMIFQSEREPGNPFYQIYLMDLKTGDTKRISPGVGKTTCAWIHPYGAKVLFASTHEDPRARVKQREELGKRASGQARRYAWDFDEHYDIYETDSEGRDFVNLTNTFGYDAEGSWSPDGRLIAFASNREAYEKELTPHDQALLQRDPSYFMDIYVMKANGTGVRRLTDTPGYDGGPFFDPDGRRIVWRRFTEDGTTAEIWTMNVDGSDQRQITHLGVMSWAPYFHPSGDYIIFANNTHGHGNFELYIVDTEGKSKSIRATDSPRFDGLPVFTPDGAHLAWASSRTADGKPQIFMAEWNDAKARELLGLPVARHTEPKIRSVVFGEMADMDQSVAAIKPEEIRAHVVYLASESLDGRLTGTQGERLATDYVASVFQSFGLEPAGDNGTYFQNFEFTAGLSLRPGNQLILRSGKAHRDVIIDKEWRPLAFSRNGAVDATGIVFAGYGIVAPRTKELPAYDSYGNVDVKDKWVMVFRYMPEDITPEHRQYLVNYSSLRYKVMLARDQGARGLIFVSGPNSQVKDQLIKLEFDTVAAGASIAVISVTDPVADVLLGSSDRTVRELQEALDSGEHVDGFLVPRISLRAAIEFRKERRVGRNVLAKLTTKGAEGDPMVIIGAHVDHIGHGTGYGSLAREDEIGKIHYGADDNAAGVGALLAIAEHLADQTARKRMKLKRDVLFAAWSGEELGLLGSGNFIQSYLDRGNNPQGSARRIAAYLNMDMIGRLSDKLYLQGVGSSSVWKGEIERHNVAVGLPVVTQDDSYLPTDTTSFYLKRVPVLNAFTGAHRDYNTPRDTPDRINYRGTARIAQLMGSILASLAIREEVPDYIATKKPTGSSTRRNLRAYMGTIPDYGDTDVKGVRLNGVAESGPASKAGLKGGDIIVELAGRTIENIYDYTYALNALKIGETVEIVVTRAGQRKRLTITPESRE